MGDHSIILLVIIVFCVIMSAYFSATETAYSTFNKIKMKNMAEDGNKKAAKVLKLDPAVMASPFITTIVDALSLLVYFLFATLLLGI